MRLSSSLRRSRHLARMLLLAACLILVAGATFAPLSAGPAPAGRKWALLVGVDTYQLDEVTPLKYAVADVKALAQALQKYCGVPADNLFLLTSDRKGGEAPTRTNVAFRLDWLAERVKPGDTVFFFFSGHGIEMNGVNYLMTCDADPRSAGTLKQSGLDTRVLQETLGGLMGGRMLVCVDACRNDPRAGRGGGDNKMSKGMTKDLTVVRKGAAAAQGGLLSATILSCSPGQRSYEWPDKRHGFFTWHVLEGLSGKAADANGRVTVPGLLSCAAVRGSAILLRTFAAPAATGVLPRTGTTTTAFVLPGPSDPVKPSSLLT